jgi:hypothetical protein
MRKSLILVSLFALCPILIAQALDNDAIIKLAKAGMSDSVIISTNNASQGSYDTSANGLIALKTAGVTDKVISALVLKASGATAAAPPSAAVNTTPTLPPGVDTIGIYYQAKDGSWQEVMTETVTRKSGGALKSFATNGLVKGDINGNLKGGSSKLKLTLPAKFIIYVPEGRSPSEYGLIRMHAHDNDREFRTQTGGFIHSSTGASKDALDFESKKIMTRVYEVVLQQGLEKGEYGFLAPTDTGNMGNAAGNGKMYTFSILE